MFIKYHQHVPFYYKTQYYENVASKNHFFCEKIINYSYICVIFSR